jgi:hypothetical protein
MKFFMRLLEKYRLRQIVYAKEVTKLLFVRYAFGNGDIGNLFDKTGLSVASFRTDNARYNLEPKN